MQARKRQGLSQKQLAGLTEQELDRQTMRRVVELQQLPDTERGHIYFTLDAMLRDVKTRKAYAS